MSTNNFDIIINEYANDTQEFVTSSDYVKIACLEIESFPTLNKPQKE